MLLLLKKTVRRGVKITCTSDPDILGVSLNGKFFGRQEDVNLWFTYAPPSTSPYAKDRKVLNTLEILLTKNTNPDNCLILGDLNGRTSEDIDYTFLTREVNTPP